MLIGPDISLFVKLWAFFIAIIEQTGASGTWVLASFGAAHDRLRFKKGFVKTSLRSFRVVEVCFIAASGDGIKN